MPELQMRFRPDFRFGIGILTADDGMAAFLVWKRMMGKSTGRMVSEIHIISVTF